MAVEREQGRRGSLAIRAEDLLVAAQQVQVKRDPIVPPGGMGFQAARSAVGDNHEPLPR
jgi:hypothetical protein